ncbi:hypothetical protein LEN26_012113, partial [Aphanomyces euteiches]
MMRSITKTFKTILVELKRPQSELRSIKNLVMLSLNHTPSSKLSGRAPITAMTQLPAGNALSAYTVDEEVVEITADQLAEWRSKIFVELAEARDNLHRELADGAAKKRDKERKRNNKDKRRREIRLAVGDYVLVGKVATTFAKKLQVQWLGPRRIVEALSDWVFVVEDLRDKQQTTHHASRLKIFAPSSLNVTQDLLDHIAYVEGGHIVETLLDCKFDRDSKRWTVLVKWLGLDIIENSWEPLDVMIEDVPKLVHRFIETNSVSNGNVRKMAQAYALLLA